MCYKLPFVAAWAKVIPSPLAQAAAAAWAVMDRLAFLTALLNCSLSTGGKTVPSSLKNRVKNAATLSASAAIPSVANRSISAQKELAVALRLFVVSSAVNAWAMDDRAAA